MNCVSCGAPIKVQQNDCPYCGTRYFNLVEYNEVMPIKLKIGDRHMFLNAVVKEMHVRVDNDCIYADNTIISSTPKLNICLTLEQVY